MAWILPLIFAAALAGSAEEAISAYRQLDKHIADARHELATNPDKVAVLTNLNLERDSVDARYPFKPGEPAALTAERRRVDVEIRSLTRHPASKNTKPPARKPKSKRR